MKDRQQDTYFEALAAELERPISQGQARLVLTSSGAGEGKSTIAAGLARALARPGLRSVLLVDADLVKPTVHELFGLSHRRGLSELMKEVYRCDLQREDPEQFGVGDWLEILWTQARTGRLIVREGEERFTLVLVRGALCSLYSQGSRERERIGDRLYASGRINGREHETAARLQQESYKPFGEILVDLGVLPRAELETVLQEQLSENLRHLLTLQRPVCQFQDTVEAYRPAANGRGELWNETPALDLRVRTRMGDFMRQPYLRSQIPSYVLDTPLPNLKVLPSGNDPLDLADPGWARTIESLFTRLGRAFDVVLVDGPPVAIGSPATALAAAAHGVLMVVKAGATDIRVVQHARTALVGSGANLLGVVMNQVRLERDPVYAYYGAYRRPA